MDMRTRARVIAAVLIAALTGGAAWAAQRGVGPGGVPPSAVGQVTGTIVGRVVDAGSGQPVAEAEITVAVRSATAGGPVVRLITGPDGRFVVREVPLGNAQVTVAAPGYLNGSLGQNRAGGPGRPLILTAEERITQVTVRLWKHASLSGMITDDANEPAVSISVRALRRTFASGQPRYSPSGFGRSDDRGMYRISGLSPGDYVVAVPQTQTSVSVASMNAAVGSMFGGEGLSAAAMELGMTGAMPTGGMGVQVGDQLVSAVSGAVPVLGGDGRMAAYLTQYFPSSATPEGATTVTLASGDSREGVDIRMPLVATARISGTVIGPDGPLANVQLRVLPVGAVSGNEMLSDVARGATAADGSFQLFGVPAGPHVIRVMRVPRPALPAGMAGNPQLQAMMGARAGGPASPSDSLALFANVPVSVERDIAGLVINLSTGATLSGRVEFVGTAAPAPMQGVTISLTPMGEQPGRVTPARVGEEGRFTLTGYPAGSYLLNVAARAGGWFVKSAAVNGIDALEQPFDLGTADIGNIVVTYVDRQSTLSGTVTGANGAPVEATVIAFPAAHREWIARGMVPRLLRNVRSQPKGAFSMMALPARDYLVVALADDDVPDLQDPRTFAALARIATSVTVTEDAPRTIALKVVQVAR